jgi:hypothetical protein
MNPRHHEPVLRQRGVPILSDPKARRFVREQVEAAKAEGRPPPTFITSDVLDALNYYDSLEAAKTNAPAESAYIAADRRQRTKRTAAVASLAAAVAGAVIPVAIDAISSTGDITLVNWPVLGASALTAALSAAGTWLGYRLAPPT